VGVPWLLAVKFRMSRLFWRLGHLLLQTGINVLDMVEGPPLVVDADRAAAYDGLLRNGGLIDYRLASPKHEFLSYAVARHGLLAHGSNRDDIEEFEPRPANEAGTIQLFVHAASDGIWPIYFATVARPAGRNVLVNGCAHVGRSDRLRRYYFFGISGDPDDDASWTDGTVYLLPGSTFRRHLGEEWISSTPVRPVARLRVRPDDFPFRRATVRVFWPEMPGRVRRRFRRRWAADLPD